MRDAQAAFSYKVKAKVWEQKKQKKNIFVSVAQPELSAFSWTLYYLIIKCAHVRNGKPAILPQY